MKAQGRSERTINYWDEPIINNLKWVWIVQKIPSVCLFSKGRHQNTQQRITKANKSLLVSLQTLAFF